MSCVCLKDITPNSILWSSTCFLDSSFFLKKSLWWLEFIYLYFVKIRSNYITNKNYYMNLRNSFRTYSRMFIWALLGLGLSWAASGTIDAILVPLCFLFLPLLQLQLTDPMTIFFISFSFFFFFPDRLLLICSLAYTDLSESGASVLEFTWHYGCIQLHIIVA